MKCSKSSCIRDGAIIKKKLEYFLIFLSIFNADSFFGVNAWCVYPLGSSDWISCSNLNLTDVPDLPSEDYLKVSIFCLNWLLLKVLKIKKLSKHKSLIWLLTYSIFAHSYN